MQCEAGQYYNTCQHKEMMEEHELSHHNAKRINSKKTNRKIHACGEKISKYKIFHHLEACPQGIETLDSHKVSVYLLLSR
jgi:hypothetical protein